MATIPPTPILRRSSAFPQFYNSEERAKCFNGLSLLDDSMESKQDTKDGCIGFINKEINDVDNYDSFNNLSSASIMVVTNLRKIKLENDLRKMQLHNMNTLTKIHITPVITHFSKNITTKTSIENKIKPIPIHRLFKLIKYIKK
jgi:hypothetical protein